MNPSSVMQQVIEHFGGTQKAAADAIGVAQPTVHAWVSGAKGVSALKAMKIEKLSGGKFKAESLCPDLKEVC